MIRVLLVEDHEPFRRFVRTTLEERQDLRLAAEASDGLDAVEKCVTLQPDLVLMDIGLPGLNGIEAARRIRTLVPACKIVFLTQEASAEIVEEALNLGAAGYVFKARAASDLLPAIAAAREGRQFVSHTGSRRDAARAGGGNSRREKLRSSRSPGNSTHRAEFYPHEASLLTAFADFVVDALESGNAAIAILTKAHRNEFLSLLRERGSNITLAIDAGRCTILDVDEALEKFMVNGLPDPARFFRAGGEIARAAKSMNQGTRVVACGEIAPTLWARGNGPAAVQVENLWNELVRMHDLGTLCGYVLTSSQREQAEDVYGGICLAHSSVRSF